MGLCSGAYHAIECGIKLGVRGVCAINPRSRLPVERPSIGSADRAAGRSCSLADTSTTGWCVISRSCSGIAEAISGWFVSPPRVPGDEGAHSLWRRRGAATRAACRLETDPPTTDLQGFLRFEHITGLEHSLLTAGPREVAMHLLTSFVVSFEHHGVGSLTRRASLAAMVPRQLELTEPGSESFLFRSMAVGACASVGARSDDTISRRVTRLVARSPASASTSRRSHGER